MHLQAVETSVGRTFQARAADESMRGSANDEVVTRAVSRAKQGDNDAVRYLYVRYSGNVYGYARSIIRDEHEAEDVTQQVFAKVMRAIAKYEQRDVPFSAWILRITHNLAIDHLRRLRAVPCEEVRSVDDVDDEGVNQQRARCLKEALETLPAEQRQVLVLRHVVGMTPGEIAERLGKSEGSIHGLHHRGRGAVKAALVELGAAPTTS